MSTEMTDFPMTIYSCRLKNSWFCKFEGETPTGASEGFGERFCKVPDSPVKSLATDCNHVDIQETQIVAKVTKGGMVT